MLNYTNSSIWTKYLYNGTNGDMDVDIQSVLKPTYNYEYEKPRVEFDQMTLMVKYNQAECYPLDKYLDGIKKMKKFSSLDKS